MMAWTGKLLKVDLGKKLEALDLKGQAVRKVEMLLQVIVDREVSRFPGKVQ
jgi:hypothetical protein